MTVPSLLLTTTGRKSGEKFIFPLFYGKAGDSYIVVASKGGAPQHPGWYRNLLANPEVEVQVGTAKMKARARTATGEERARLWQKALSSGRPTPITSARPSARSPSSCSTPCADPGCRRRVEQARRPGKNTLQELFVTPAKALGHAQMVACNIKFLSSWPGLTRPSTRCRTCEYLMCNDVDARIKSGHDDYK